MAHAVQTLDWQFTNDDTTGYVALVPVDSAVDTTWNIAITTAVQRGDRPIVPKWVTIDNISNNGIVTILYGPLSFSVPQFQRLSFQLPLNTRSVQIISTVGVVNVWFSEKQVAADVLNQLLVSQTAVKTVIYGYLTYSLTTAQSAADQNAETLFKPTLGNINYNLLPITPTPIANGWLQYIKNEGTKKLTIIPNGADLVTYKNFDFTSASALTLRPGEFGILTCDGTKWHFEGNAFYFTGINVGVSIGQALTNNTLNLIFTNAAPATYSLLSLATTNIAYYIPIGNYGTSTVTIQPNGADTINGLFTAANPLVLRPGDGGVLSTDGVGWFYVGSQSYESAELAIVSGAVSSGTFAHGLFKKPTNAKTVLRCKTAELNYAVSDELDFGLIAYWNGANINSSLVMVVDATNIYYATQGGVLQYAIPDKNLGGMANITPARWKLVFFASA